MEETDKIEESKTRIYQTNSPISDLGYFSHYINAVDSVIDGNDILNIGIVSPYSAGKSSFIKSFFDKHQDRKKETCFVSLASFGKIKIGKIIDEENNDAADNMFISQNRVEISILEQLIYKRKYHYKSKSKIERIKGRIFDSLLSAFLLIGTIVFILLSIAEFNSKLGPTDGKYFYVYASISLLFSIITTAYMLYSKRIKRLSIHNIEFELDSAKEASMLNRFIDEIINFCIETKTKYIVFEDIDRFDCVNLFLKLREINKLLNDNESIIKKVGKVTFIYCVREGIFDSTEDRAKFFDFTISLVPYFNPDNAREVFEKATKQSDDLYINAEDVKELTYFVKDVRVLKTIINDYILYKDVLKIDKENNKKLFAMMIYKNLSFNDFSELQTNSGTLYNVFNVYKTNAFKNASLRFEKELADLQDEMDNALEMVSVSKKLVELKDRISGILAMHGSNGTSAPQGYLDNATINTYENVKDGLYIKQSFKSMYGYTESNVKYLSSNSLKGYLEEKTPYEVEQSIINGTKQNYLNKISEAAKNLTCYRNMTVEELISAGFFAEEDLNKIKENKFLYYAISNGYIDENYFNFSGRKDVQVDNEFIERVISREEIEPDQVVQNPVLVISRLSINRFSTQSILNYSIIDALLASDRKYKEKRKAFISYLLERNGKTIEFLVNYFTYGKEKTELLKELFAANYHNLVDDIVSFCGGYTEQFSNFFKEIIKLKENRKIIEFYNKDQAIKRAIENDEKLIERYLPSFINEVEFVYFLESLGVNCILKIDDSGISSSENAKRCLALLFENNLLDINANNITLIGKYVFKKEVVSLSDLTNYKNENTSSFYKSNLEKTISALYEVDNKFSDSDNVVASILTNPSLNDETKNKYLLLLKSKVKYIDGLSPSIYSTMLANNLLVPKWSSLITIDKKNITEEIMVKYIADNIDSFDDKIVDKEFFVKNINSEKTKSDICSKMCGYLSSTVGINEIKEDKKRSIVIKAGHIILDRNCLFACKDCKMSFGACVETKPELINDLSTVLTKPSEYIELINSKDISYIVKCRIIDKNYKMFLSSATENDILNMKDLIIANADIKYDKNCLFEIIKLLHNTKDKIDIAESFDAYFVDADIVNIVKMNDLELFNKLSSGKANVSLDISYVDNNEFFNLLKSRSIVNITSRRINKCNVDVRTLRQL